MRAGILIGMAMWAMLFIAVSTLCSCTGGLA